jgi:hypothetical protein
VRATGQGFEEALLGPGLVGEDAWGSFVAEVFEQGACWVLETGVDANVTLATAVAY